VPLAEGPCRRAYAIDRRRLPADLLKQLAAAGAMSAHLEKADGTPGDYMPGHPAMAEARQGLRRHRLHDVVPVRVPACTCSLGQPGA
jgi:hypothetical protein